MAKFHEKTQQAAFAVIDMAIKDLDLTESQVAYLQNFFTGIKNNMGPTHGTLIQEIALEVFRPKLDVPVLMASLVQMCGEFAVRMAPWVSEQDYEMLRNDNDTKEGVLAISVYGAILQRVQYYAEKYVAENPDKL